MASVIVENDTSGEPRHIVVKETYTPEEERIARQDFEAHQKVQEKVLEIIITTQAITEIGPFQRKKNRDKTVSISRVLELQIPMETEAIVDRIEVFESRHPHQFHLIQEALKLPI